MPLQIYLLFIQPNIYKLYTVIGQIKFNPHRFKVNPEIQVSS